MGASLEFRGIQVLSQLETVPLSFRLCSTNRRVPLEFSYETLLLLRYEGNTGILQNEAKESALSRDEVVNMGHFSICCVKPRC